MKIIIDVSKANKFLDSGNKRIRLGVTSIIKSSTKLGLNLAKQLAPVDTGALISNITMKTYKKGNTQHGEIKSGAIGGVPYNIYQEYGTGMSGANKLLHPRAKGSPINPRNDLTFNTGISGFGAQPFMYPTFIYLSDKIGQDVDKLIEEVISWLKHNWNLKYMIC